MRRIRYSVAMSLDGFIAGPNGEADWIVMDPEIDFGEIWGQFDTLIMGRKTFGPPKPAKSSEKNPYGEMRTFVVSRSLKQADYPGVTILGEDCVEKLTALREEPGKDIWLWGGGELFRSLARFGLVDTVEVGVMPVLLGDGVPLLPAPTPAMQLSLVKQTTVETSGIVGLEYEIRRP